MHKVLVNLLGGLSLPRKSVDRLTDRHKMTLDVYRGCKTTTTNQRSAINVNKLNMETAQLQMRQLPYFFSYRMEFFSFENNPKI